MKKFVCDFGSKYFTCDCIIVTENAVLSPSTISHGPPVIPTPVAKDGVQPKAILLEEK